MRVHSAFIALCVLTLSGVSNVEAKWKALIIDGQNNHAMWPKITIMMKQYLEDTELFTVDVERTAFSDKDLRGTGRHEPMLITINFGKGRVFHTPMGDSDYSLECVGFIVAFTRGAEWAATGKVTQKEIPVDFPSANKSSQRPFRTDR